jgi:hypothetical protein
MIIRNVCLSRRWKADLESFKIYIQTLVSLTQLVAQKPDPTPVAQSVHKAEVMVKFHQKLFLYRKV